MSSSRVIDEVVSLVWRVDSTRWPVCAARKAVANLSHHDDVGVLPQNRAQHRGERQPLLLVDVDLGNALHVVLDRVFDGHDVASRRIDLLDHRVERAALAAARRSGHEDHALGLPEQGADLLEIADRQPELVELARRPVRIEQAQHELFAVGRRQHGDPHVDDAAVMTDREVPVLRSSPFGDVGLRHDLDAGGDRVLHPLRKLVAVDEHAVDAVADDDDVGTRLDVDVARLDGHRVGEDEVHHLDDRRLLRLLSERLGVELVRGARAGNQLERAVGHAGEDGGEGTLVAVGALDCGENLGAPGDDATNATARSEFHALDRLLVERIGHGQSHALLVGGDGEERKAGGRLFVHEVHDPLVDAGGREATPWDAQPRAHAVRELLLGDASVEGEKFDGGHPALLALRLDRFSGGTVELADLHQKPE
jgi:hypothetical protein